MNIQLKMLTLLFTIGVSFVWAPRVFAALDSDGDKIPNVVEETVYFTDPQLVDTDGDGFSDYDEIYHGYSALHGGKLKMGLVDSDGDGAPDSWEVKLGTNLTNPDTDGDGFSDGDEINAGFSPSSPVADKQQKRIAVDLKTQTLSYYFNEIQLESFFISSGLWNTPTPKGNFSVQLKMPVHLYSGPDYYFPNTLWNLHFATGSLGRFFIHGAYWHNNFGKPMSHGCVNVSYTHMSRLYDFAEVGTPIEIK